MFRAGQKLKLFAILQSLGSITVGMSMPFPFVYAADFKGADAITIGYMGTCFSLAAMVLAIPMGMLSDSKGRKITIFLTRPFFYASLILNVNWRQVEIDSRPSDAIAIALRVKMPIYVEEAVLDKAGIQLDQEEDRPIIMRMEEGKTGISL